MPNATQGSWGREPHDGAVGAEDSTARDLTHFDQARVVVTGGLGFIGSNVAVRLAAAGARITVVDALVPRHGGNARNIEGIDAEVVVTGIADAAALASVVAGADYVFNLAGQVSHVDSVDDPLTDFDLNARSNLAFVDLLHRVAPDATVVYGSTRQVYGRPQYLPVDEQHPIAPVDVNGISKYAAEQSHMLYAAIHAMRISALRITNVYGPRQRLRGEHMGFMPVFIARALEDRPITVFGDGSQARDCLFVDDVVEALILAAITPEAAGEVFNIGNDQRLSLGEIAATVTAVAGTGRVEYAAWPREHERIDIGSYQADSSKAKRVLGWEASVELTDGLRATFDYYRRHLQWYL